MPFGNWVSVVGHHNLGKANSSNLHLLALCSEHTWNIMNTNYQLANKYRSTWMLPRSQHWHLIDYIIVRQRDRPLVKVTRAMRGAEVFPDHRLESKMTNEETRKDFSSALERRLGARERRPVAIP